MHHLKVEPFPLISDWLLGNACCGGVCSKLGHVVLGDLNSGTYQNC